MRFKRTGKGSRGRRGSELSSVRQTRLEVQPLEDRLLLTVLPAGFREVKINTTAMSVPTAMEFSPVGELFVLEQTGQARLVRPDGTTNSAFRMDNGAASPLAVDSVGERGLLGIAFDPSYDGAGPNTDFVYLYYTTPANGPIDLHNRISRFTVLGAGESNPRFDKTSEDILRDLPDNAEDNDSNHNGGAIHFGIDGKLYVAVGDHNYDPAMLEDHPGQNFDTPFGKILRLNPDGSDPGDNPFHKDDFDPATEAWLNATWAMGLRNPFTFAFKPGTSTMYINDVGESSWEEIDEGVAGANYGWTGSPSPRTEGFDTPPLFVQNYHDPIMAYDRVDTPNVPDAPAGIAITGGAFYPANSQFGSAYANKYFFADYSGNFIRIFDPNIPGTPTNPDTSLPFASTLSGQSVDLKVDAKGSLYYLTHGGNVYRISLTQVVDRQLFYNQSAFDGNTAGVSPSDALALATDKVAYRPGDGAMNTDSYEHVSSYSRGINGVFVDISGPHAASLTAADFEFRVNTGTNNSPSTWALAPSPSTITILPNTPAVGTDRIEIIWPNNSIRNNWLAVYIKANANTGLTANATKYGAGNGDLFFFGNRIGDTGINAGSFSTGVNDETATHGSGTGTAAITNRFDFDRNKAVGVNDETLAHLSGGVLNYINIGTPPLAPPPASRGSSSATEEDAGISSALAAATPAKDGASRVAHSPARPAVEERLHSRSNPGGLFQALDQKSLQDLRARLLADERLELEWITAAGGFDDNLLEQLIPCLGR